MPPAPIILAGQLIATDNDVLANTRLQSIDAAGSLFIQVACNVCDVDGGNYFQMTLQLPGGENPMDSVIVPAVPDLALGVMDERSMIAYSCNVSTGGHVTLGFAETGAAVLTYRVAYQAF